MLHDEPAESDASGADEPAENGTIRVEGHDLVCIENLEKPVVSARRQRRSARNDSKGQPAESTTEKKKKSGNYQVVTRSRRKKDDKKDPGQK